MSLIYSLTSSLHINFTDGPSGQPSTKPTDEPTCKPAINSRLSRQPTEELFELPSGKSSGAPTREPSGYLYIIIISEKKQKK